MTGTALQQPIRDDGRQRQYQYYPIERTHEKLSVSHLKNPISSNKKISSDRYQPVHRLKKGGLSLMSIA
jgi:hypothetical protein